MQTSRLLLRSSLVALAVALPLGWSARASADTVCGDTTCPKNYECKDEPVPCPDIACAPDQPNCTPPDCSGTTPRCEPLPCTNDADCADGMVCYTTTTTQDCPTAPPCAGDNCPDAVPCTPEAFSACVPRYLVPCEQADDCGPGFSCDAEQECSCAGSTGSGSSGSASGSAGASSSGTPAAGDAATPDPAPAPTPAPDVDAGMPDPGAEGGMPAPEPADGGAPPSDCTCKPLDTKACNLKVVACSVDAGCLPGWSCQDNPYGACWASADGSSGCSADPPKICLPPYSDLVSVAHDGSNAAGQDSGTGGSPTGTPEEPVPPKEDTGSSASSAGTTGAGSQPAASSDGGGCSIGRAPGSAGAAFGFAALACLGLLGARRRRAG